MRPLGASELAVSPVGLGRWQFSGGRGLAGSYWPALARALHALGQRSGDVTIATKWRPFFRTARSILTTIDEWLEHLEGYPADLFQIHAPMSLSSIPTQMRAMLQREGKIRAVGVGNLSAPQLRKAHETLAEEGFSLVSNQVRFSLLDRRIESNGVLDTARELGASIIAYSPFGQGLLTGKFHENPELLQGLRGPRRWMGSFRREQLERTAPLVEELRRIAAGYEASPAQVALNWVISRHGGTVLTIPGASKPAQARLNAGAQGFELSAPEIRRLSELWREIG